MIKNLNISKDLLIQEIDIALPTISNIYLNLLHNGTLLFVSIIWCMLHRALYRSFKRLGSRYINVIIIPSFVYLYICIPLEIIVKVLRTIYYPLTDLIGNELCYIITWMEVHASIYAQMHTFFITFFRYVCLFHEKLLLRLTPRNFGKIVSLLSFLITLIITYGIVIATDDPVPLNTCLGHYERNYLKIGGYQLCNNGTDFQMIFCKVVFVFYAVISSHIPEAILLYRCFRMIQIQTELSHPLIGDKQYIRRRRYFITRNPFLSDQKNIFQGTMESLFPFPSCNGLWKFVQLPFTWLLFSISMDGGISQTNSLPYSSSFPQPLFNPHFT